MNMEITDTTVAEHLPRREREKAKHRQVIYNTAITQFAQKGFHAATMDDIATAAEFSKGAIYIYFTNKENLLFQIMKQSVEETKSFVFESLPGQRPFRDELIDLLKHAAAFTLNSRELCDLVVSQHHQHFRALSDDHRRILKEIYDDIARHIEQRITDAIDTKELDDISPRLVSEIIAGALNTVVALARYYDTRDAIHHNIESFVALLYEGIASRDSSAG